MKTRKLSPALIDTEHIINNNGFMQTQNVKKDIMSLKYEIFHIKNQLQFMKSHNKRTTNLKKYLNAKIIECDHLIVLNEHYKTIDSEVE